MLGSHEVLHNRQREAGFTGTFHKQSSVDTCPHSQFVFIPLFYLIGDLVPLSSNLLMMNIVPSFESLTHKLGA